MCTYFNTNIYFWLLYIIIGFALILDLHYVTRDTKGDEQD